jgi:hypothetical protein
MKPYANAQHITSSDADQVPLNVHFCTTSDPTTLAIYAGAQRLGFVRAVHEARFQSLDLQRRVIGEYPDIHSAMRRCWRAR